MVVFWPIILQQGRLQFMDIQEITNRVEKDSIIIKKIFSEIEKVVVGQRNLLERMIIGLLSDGHLLALGHNLRIVQIQVPQPDVFP